MIGCEFAEESVTVSVERLREVNEIVRIRELEVAEGADGMAENIDLSDSTREGLRSGSERLRNRSPEFLEKLEELEADLRTAVAVGRTTESEARTASWRGTDRLISRVARLGENLFQRWMHMDRMERLILQLMGEQDLKSIGVTEFPWPERRKSRSMSRMAGSKGTEDQPRRWWPSGRSRARVDANAAIEEALRVLDDASDQVRDDDASK